MIGWSTRTRTYTKILYFDPRPFRRAQRQSIDFPLFEYNPPIEVLLNRNSIWTLIYHKTQIDNR